MRKILVGIKRKDEFNDRLVHIIDPENGRGLMIHYNGGWNFAKTKNIGNRRSLDDDSIKYLVRIGYIPMEIPRSEFNSIYEKTMSKTKERSLFTCLGDFSPRELPSIREIVEETFSDYENRFQRVFRSK